MLSGYEKKLFGYEITYYGLLSGYKITAKIVI